VDIIRFLAYCLNKTTLYFCYYFVSSKNQQNEVFHVLASHNSWGNYSYLWICGDQHADGRKKSLWLIEERLPVREVM
jgi:hypothetical protein